MYSNRYIVIYASVMVVIVATVLATAAMQLKPFQEKNVRIEKMQNILTSVNIASTPDDAEQKYRQYIQEELVIDHDGNVIGNEAFDIDLATELRKPENERSYPLFISELQGNQYYIVPMRGKGLWGPIWGYIAIEDDLNTVYGANFDHKSETPGLGAEINEVAFQEQFVGKKIFDESGKFTSIIVRKGGAREGTINEVDAISGGTITSDGVTYMLRDGISNYLSYFQNQRRQS
jgi:Na+-transporting NADH:ubiquinone oxidoreductase subunit C